MSDRPMAERHEWTDYSVGSGGVALAIRVIPDEESAIPLAFTANGNNCDPAEWGLEYAAELLRVVAERDEALRRLAEEERACLEVIDERDAMEDRVNAIADELGVEAEWTTETDRAQEAIEAAALLEAQRDALGKALQLAARHLAELPHEASGRLALIQEAMDNALRAAGLLPEEEP